MNWHITGASIEAHTLKTSSACCLVMPAGIGAPGCWTAGGACTDAMVVKWSGNAMPLDSIKSKYLDVVTATYVACRARYSRPVVVAQAA